MGTTGFRHAKYAREGTSKNATSAELRAKMVSTQAQAVQATNIPQKKELFARVNALKERYQQALSAEKNRNITERNALAKTVNANGKQNTQPKKTTHNPQEIASWQKAAAQGSEAAIKALNNIGQYPPVETAQPKQRSIIATPVAASFNVPAQLEVVPAKKTINKPKKVETTSEKQKANAVKKEDFSNIDKKLTDDVNFQNAITNMERIEIVGGITTGIKIIQKKMKPPFMMTENNKYSSLFQDTTPETLVRYIHQLKNS